MMLNRKFLTNPLTLLFRNTVLHCIDQVKLSFDRKVPDSDALFEIKVLSELPSKPKVLWIEQEMMTKNLKNRGKTVDQLRRRFGLSKLEEPVVESVEEADEDDVDDEEEEEAK